MTQATFTLNHIQKKFMHVNQIVSVLNNIDMIFMQGKSYAIIGKSGVGKSTLMHIIAGIDTPSSGTVFFNTNALSSMSKDELSCHLNKSIGLVFQSSHLMKELTVLENVMLPGMIGNQDTDDLKKRAHTLLKMVGVDEQSLYIPGQLCGGEQQRVALARALINRPVVLIAAEPTGNVDYATGTMSIELMLNCQKEWGMGLIVSSHDSYVAQAMDEVYELV